ncbi:hypothetical protein DFH94DRAFT_723994 [Russula ochroleuca]|uniref:Secreted protein n=1 Tax=Russula ochroleuca TaxID=152965 RepID=A0A9P5N193_9AGAM|nr:hypothetical protein DFH94DRAFT_723994 [Russula ochroleuca]
MTSASPWALLLALLHCPCTRGMQHVQVWSTSATNAFLYLYQKIDGTGKVYLLRCYLVRWFVATFERLNHLQVVESVV